MVRDSYYVQIMDSYAETYDEIMQRVNFYADYAEILHVVQKLWGNYAQSSTVMQTIADNTLK